ncbi:MAG: DUF4307 domain-containing protein [Kineosporiaceae bacterium]|nr:DUF4307 domain-containing protein [Kineosporiaceae bacterium]
MTSPELLAQRYGRSSTPTRNRRPLTIALVAFVVIGVTFAVWASAARGRTNVTWVDLGSREVTVDSATFTFQLGLPPGDTAICTIRAVNEGLVEVGRRDVRVGPSATGQVRTSVTVRTTERAAGGGVKACVLV